MTALEYLKEKARLTNNCNIDCSDCRLSSENSGEELGCEKLEQDCPEKAVEIMEQWSKDCPQKTRLQDFKEKYPNAPLGENGVPGICIDRLGYAYSMDCIYEDIDCKTCWNTPLEE